MIGGMLSPEVGLGLSQGVKFFRYAESYQLVNYHRKLEIKLPLSSQDSLSDPFWQHLSDRLSPLCLV